MRYTLYAFLLLTLLACAKKIYIEELVIEKAWAGTNGAIVVKKGVLSDTIYDCKFGISPDYEILKSNGKKYLFTTCDMSGGGNNTKSLVLWSLDKKSFLDTLFYKEIYTSEISNDHPQYPEFRKWTQREADFNFKNQKVTLTIDSVVANVHWDTAEPVDTISMGDKTIYLKID